MAASLDEDAEWLSVLEHPEKFYTDAARYWEVGEEMSSDSTLFFFAMADCSLHSGWNAGWTWRLVSLRYGCFQEIHLLPTGGEV